MPVRILLADKSITIQKVVEMLFSGRDYEVLCVSDGETALTEAARVVPDVVLADVDLPRVDGYTLSANFRKTPALAQTPVILMMSRDDVFDANKGKLSGILDHIAKPFESQELIGKVKKALAAAPPRLAEPVAPRPPAAPRAPEPQRPAVSPPAAAPKAAPPAKPKAAAPADIFDIISEAPSQEDLKQGSADIEEETFYEVEPEIEEVEEPLAREIGKTLPKEAEPAIYEVEPEIEEVPEQLSRELATSLPVGAKAVEEMRAGLGLEDVQPEIATFETFDIDVKEEETTQTIVKAAASALASQPLDKVVASPPPAVQTTSQQQMPSERELRSIVEETVSRLAKEYFAHLPPPSQPQVSEAQLRNIVEEKVAAMTKTALAAVPKAESTQAGTQALSASDIWSIAEETVSRMTKDLLDKQPQASSSPVSDERLRRMVEEASALATEHAAGKTTPQQPALPMQELRSMAEETLNRMARDVFKDITPPIPKISDETIRQGIEQAIWKIAHDVAKETIEQVAWEVIPRLAEHMIKQEIERIKAEP